MKISVIVPYLNEYPQIIFTLQSIAQALKNKCDFEVIAIDNYCAEFDDQHEVGLKRITDQFSGQGLDVPPAIADWVKERRNRVKKGTAAVKACDRHNPWLKYLNYDKKMSHWQAKNMGVANSDGEILWFCDSHCVAPAFSVYEMFKEYSENLDKYDGSMHLPLTYKILESRRLIYKLAWNWDRAEIHYSFTGFRDATEPYEVPCMSTCGMMISRDLFYKLGGWPTELGIYGGGENFINFSLAVMGKKKWIYPGAALHHHGDSRGYHWLYDDHVRNKCIAMYCYAGKEVTRRFMSNTKGRQEALDQIYEDVIAKCKDHRALIKAQQVMTIDQWAKGWGR
jgi:glycosyltransferase involved in cell wall biosynthesis